MSGITKRNEIGLLTPALVTLLLLTTSMPYILGIQATPEDEPEVDRQFTISGQGVAATKENGQLVKYPSTIELQAKVSSMERHEITMKQFLQRLPEKARKRIMDRLKEIAEKKNIPLDRLLERLDQIKITVIIVKFEVKSGHIKIGDEKFPVTSGTGTYVHARGRISGFSMKLEAAGIGGKKDISLTGRGASAVGKIVGKGVRYALRYRLTL